MLLYAALWFFDILIAALVSENMNNDTYLLLQRNQNVDAPAEEILYINTLITQPHGKKKSSRLDHSTYMFSGLLSPNLESVLSDLFEFLTSKKGPKFA